jgi:hypothetical protein
VVYSNFLNLRGSQIWAAPQGAQLGGHAMLVVGYDDARGAFKVINSWGQGWGEAGYGWISYDLFPRVVQEAYIVRDAPNGTAPNTTPTTSPAERSAFAIGDVRHNVPAGQWGLAMYFGGMLNVPAGAGSSVQVVILVYADAGGGRKGVPVGALAPQFAMPHGQAATGTPQTPLPPNGLQTQWFAYLPYGALNIPRGRPVGLVAEPVLYVDNFGIRTGQIVPFTVVLP